MKRLITLLTGIIAVSPLVAQNAPPAAAPSTVPPRSTPPQIPGASGATTLRGEAKLRYLGRRLNLTTDQQKSFDGLVDTYKVSVDAESQNQTAYLTQLKELIAAQTAAEQSGDKERAEQIRKQINETRPGVRAEAEFFLNLEKGLTADQKEILAILRQHAEKPGGLDLTPAYILATARALELTPEQAKRIDSLQGGAIATMNPLGGQPPPREPVRDKLLADIRAVLTPEQQKKFDIRTDILKSRPGDEVGPPPAPAPVPGAGGGVPAAPPPGK